jgi:hypothetical protein
MSANRRRRRRQLVVEFEPSLEPLCLINDIPHDMWDIIMRCCGPRDLWTLYNTCQTLQKYVKSRIQKRLNGSEMTQALYTQLVMVEGNYVALILYATKFLNDLPIAAIHGHIDILDTFIHSERVNLNRDNQLILIKSAVNGDQIELLKYFRRLGWSMLNMTNLAIEKSAIQTAKWLIRNPRFDANQNNLYFTACAVGDIEVIDETRRIGNCNLNCGMCEAGMYGKLPAVIHLLELGANNYLCSLDKAVRAGQLEIIKKIYPLAGNHSNRYFALACLVRQVAIMKYFRNLGATQCDCGVHINSHDYSES